MSERFPREGHVIASGKEACLEQALVKIKREVGLGIEKFVVKIYQLHFENLDIISHKEVRRVLQEFYEVYILKALSEEGVVHFQNLRSQISEFKGIPLDEELLAEVYTSVQEKFRQFLRK